MIINGIIVQGNTVQRYFDTPDRPEETVYQGISRYESWPLELETDADSRFLTKYLKEKYLFRLYSDNKPLVDCIRELAIAREYLQCCRRKSLPVRVFAVGSHQPFPMDQVPKGLTFLGYEFASCQGNFSSITYDDFFFCNLDPEYRQFADLLNENGLFSSEEDLRRSVKKRIEIYGDSGDIEHISEYDEYLGIWRWDGWEAAVGMDKKVSISVKQTPGP